MYTDMDKEPERKISKGIESFKMAIDNRPEHDRFAFSKPTTDEFENEKKDIVRTISEKLITTYSPEDRYDIFNGIRKNLEEDLRRECNELHSKINYDTQYFNALKDLVY